MLVAAVLALLHATWNAIAHGAFVFAEPLGRRRIAAAAVVLTGVVLLAIR